MTTYAINAVALRKRYGDTRALDGLDLHVPEGMIYGLLGPNGAGKTTAVRLLTTLARIDEGRAEVCGTDVARDPQQVRSMIGLTGQYAAVDESLTGRENLVLFGRLFQLSTRAARRRADELLEKFSLTAAGNRPAQGYSGGMRRRLDLAASLIQRPRVLFLDEPTTGLDPRSRNEVWQAVRELAAEGTTVLLTTQYLEEADQLTARIAVIDRGRAVAEGTPDELKSVIAGDRLEVVVHSAAELATAARIVEDSCAGEAVTDPDNRTVSAGVIDRMASLGAAVQALQSAGVTVVDIGLRRPSLDEAFLQLTGSNPHKEQR